MKTLKAAGGLALLALTFPASAAAHIPTATVSCTAAQFEFSSFRTGSNTVDYRVSVDGTPSVQGTFTLNGPDGRSGSLSIPLSLNDTHRVTAFAWWGPTGIQDGHTRPAGSSALANTVVTCQASPPPTPTPTPPATPTPTPTPEPTPAPTPAAETAPAPPAPARGGVQGVTRISPVNSKQARADAKCVSTPASVSVRARELTTVRVRVKADGTSPAGALVRVTGPGLVRKLTTNAEGVAIFRVRPVRSGTLVIQSDRCVGADRVAVRSARRVSGRRLPRVTG